VTGEVQPVVALAILPCLSLVWALYAYVIAERKGRSNWQSTKAEVVVESTDQYGNHEHRAGALDSRASAPGLVKASAFVCFSVGQALALVFYLVVLVRALRPGAGERADRDNELATEMYRLGPKLLARDDESPSALRRTAKRLGTSSAGMGLVSLFLLLDGPLNAAFYVSVTVGAMFGVAALGLAFTTTHDALFRARDDE
jgi:hypothetical protein